jgi:hypothetical protein
VQIRLQIAMDDPFLVRRLEGFGDLRSDAERLANRNGSARPQSDPRAWKLPPARGPGFSRASGPPRERLFPQRQKCQLVMRVLEIRQQAIGHRCVNGQTA